MRAYCFRFVAVMSMSGFVPLGALAKSDDASLWTIKRGDLVEQRTFQGEAQAESKVEIRAPQISWDIAERFVLSFVPDDGAVLKAGELAVSFEDSSVREKRVQAELTYHLALAELKQEQSVRALERINLELDLEKKKLLLKKAEIAIVKGALISAIEESKAKLDRDALVYEEQLAKKKLAEFGVQQRTGIAAKEEKAAIAKRALDDFDTALARMKITAPAPGIVYRPFSDLDRVKGRAERGRLVRAGDLLLEFPDFSTFIAHVYAHPADLQYFQVGDSARLSFPAIPGAKAEGKIKQTDSFITTRKERLGIGDAEGALQEGHIVVSMGSIPAALRPGMSTKVSIIATRAKNVLLVPLYAVTEAEGKHTVLMDSGVVREISLGKTTTQFGEVVKGLKEGERIKRLPDGVL